ncbi:MAG: hypothetical protein LBS65_05980 [Desulfovibrio sp.]|nr:hypothetical protein [Desulfovibrio sp.]
MKVRFQTVPEKSDATTAALDQFTTDGQQKRLDIGQTRFFNVGVTKMEAGVFRCLLFMLNSVSLVSLSISGTGNFRAFHT